MTRSSNKGGPLTTDEAIRLRQAAINRAYQELVLYCVFGQTDYGMTDYSWEQSRYIVAGYIYVVSFKDELLVAV